MGLCWNASTFAISIPDNRISEIVASIECLLSNKVYVTARRLAKIGGRIISLMPVIGNVARIKTRSLFRCIEARHSWDRVFCLCDQAVIDELLFWKANVSRLNRRKLCQYELPFAVIFTDAGSFACAGFTQGSDPNVFHYMWNDKEIDMSSTWREVKAIELYLRQFVHNLQSKTVKFFTDSKCAESVIAVGSSKPHLHELALSIFSVCAQNSIDLEVQWVPRSLNKTADTLSKVFDYDDWGVSIAFFRFVDDMFGPHSFDRFANSQNCKLPSFSSRFATPCTSGIDAFSMDWAGHNNWLVPPVSLVPKAIIV